MYNEHLTTIQVRLKANKQQSSMLQQHFGSTRFIWNYMLAYMLRDNKWYSYEHIANILPELKKTDDYKWLKDVNSQALQQTLKKLSLSVRSYFRNKNKGIKTGTPRFRSRKDNNDYFISPQHNILVGNKLTLPKIGTVTISHIPDTIMDILELKQVIVKRDIKGNYYASLICRVLEIKKDTIDSTIGIDVNTSNLLTDSNGKMVQSLYKIPKIKKIYTRIIKAQQLLSCKIKGSKSFKALRLLIAKLWYKITLIKKDVIHKVSDKYSRYKWIKMEKLNIKKMSKNTSGTVDNPNIDSVKKSRLNRVMLSNNWYSLMLHIKYKAERLGNHLLLIDPAYTSQTCSKCGYVSKDNRLTQSKFKCKKCGFELNADHNAALNILVA